MSIRMIARDLYRLEREVEKLEKQLNTAPFDKRAQFEDQLRKVKADRPPFKDGYCYRVDSLGHFILKYSDDHSRS